MKSMSLVSACLLGIDCRYDGRNSISGKVLRLIGKEILIPVCPEQLGGLATPREPMRIIGGGGSEVLDGKAKVINKIGEDVSKNLIKGAEETLKIVRSLGVRRAIFKSRSPSCGCGQIYDEASLRIVRGDGVATALLKRNGVEVITEEDL